MQVPENPVLFSKSSSLHGHNQPIVMPTNSLDNDYEAELTIVIGKEEKREKEQL